jgi:formylglycine-generating enzyme required for sulfatase activity
LALATRADAPSHRRGADAETQLAADIFATGGNTFTMDFVSIGNLANAPDDTTYGSVPYAYRLGTYEVSRDMMTKANNLGGLGITMHDRTSFGGNGANRPATGVSWYEAAAFVNWLNASTAHQPAYTLSGASLTLWPSGDAWQAGGENRYRHKDAFYFLPSENEWYKAAYYDGGLGAYYNYPTGSDAAPTPVSSAGSSGCRHALSHQSAICSMGNRGSSFRQAATTSCETFSSARSRGFMHRVRQRAAWPPRASYGAP